MEPCVIALGFFDGLHLGHQRVIGEARKIADEKNLPLAVMSFFPHPQVVLSDGKKNIQYLMPVMDKQKSLEGLGVDRCYLIKFDNEFAALSPKQFVEQYLLDFKAVHVVAGFDFTYGCRGAGHIDSLEEDADMQFRVTKVNKVECRGKKISSTLIREKISLGEMESIPDYLGQCYQIEGKVSVSKNKVTFNASPHYQLPAEGIYEVTVFEDGHRWMQVVEVVNHSLYFYLDENQERLLEGQLVRIRFEKERFLTNDRSPENRRNAVLI